MSDAPPIEGVTIEALRFGIEAIAGDFASVILMIAEGLDRAIEESEGDADLKNASAPVIRRVTFSSEDIDRIRRMAEVVVESLHTSGAIDIVRNKKWADAVISAAGVATMRMNAGAIPFVELCALDPDLISFVVADGRVYPQIRDVHDEGN